MTETVQVVSAAELTEGHATPGMTRQQAVDSGTMWSGLAHTEPGAETAWHHHDGYDSTLYVLTGVLRMEFGPGGATSADAGPGDFVHVPAHVVHRELNPTEQRSSAVVVRAGTGTPVVNVDGPDPA